MIKTNDTTTSRRSLLAGAPAVAAAALAGGTVATARAETDPIYAAIEEHKRALAAHVTALQAGADENETDKLCNAELDAVEALLRCEPEPTTVGGVVALLDYLSESYDHAEETILSFAMVSLAEQAARDFPSALADALRRMT
jgi:hypothetical protein